MVSLLHSRHSKEEATASSRFKPEAMASSRRSLEAMAPLKIRDTRCRRHRNPTMHHRRDGAGVEGRVHSPTGHGDRMRPGVHSLFLMPLVDWDIVHSAAG